MLSLLHPRQDFRCLASPHTRLMGLTLFGQSGVLFDILYSEDSDMLIHGKPDALLVAKMSWNGSDGNCYFRVACVDSFLWAMGWERYHLACVAAISGCDYILTSSRSHIKGISTATAMEIVTNTALNGSMTHEDMAASILQVIRKMRWCRNGRWMLSRV